MSIGIWQILVIVILVFLLFGSGRMPRIMGDLAKGLKSFKEGLNDEDDATKALPRTPDSASKEKDPRAGE